MHEFAELNPQFGVHFPLGQRDRPHMEPTAGKPSAFRVASLGYFQRKITPCTKMPLMLSDEILD